MADSTSSAYSSAATLPRSAITARASAFFARSAAILAFLDRGKLAVDPASLTVSVDDDLLQFPMYSALAGRRIEVPITSEHGDGFVITGRNIARRLTVPSEKIQV